MSAVVEVRSSFLGGPDFATFVVELPRGLTKEAVDTVFQDVATVKANAGKNLDIYVYFQDAADVPAQFASKVALSDATVAARGAAEKKRADEEKLVNVFLALNDRALALNLSDAKLNDLAVVKELLIANDARAIDEARDILGKYDTSRKGDAAQRAALEAFARFGYAASRR